MKSCIKNIRVGDRVRILLNEVIQEFPIIDIRNDVPAIGSNINYHNMFIKSNECTSSYKYKYSFFYDIHDFRLIKTIKK